jgi:D-psicose/D-tagatose/L-ribulose 3-epimerase
MLLWTTHVTRKHRPILEALKATGYDGVEIPVFEGTPDHFADIGRMLDEIGLQRTAITVVPTRDKNPSDKDAAIRKAATDYLNYCVDCTAALGATCIGGPLTQTLGHFSGKGATDAERSRARSVHRRVGDHAAKQGVKLAIEAVNRFETYFVNTMHDLAAYLDFVDHPAIQGMYDTFHANIEEADPVAAIETIRPHMIHVHISENDRGVPGRGHVPWAATFKALKRSGYDGWLTIEAFGRGLPELAAATRVWRDFSEGPEAVYTEGFETIRKGWKKA